MDHGCYCITAAHSHRPFKVDASTALEALTDRRAGLNILFGSSSPAMLRHWSGCVTSANRSVGSAMPVPSAICCFPSSLAKKADYLWLVLPPAPLRATSEG